MEYSKLKSLQEISESDVIYDVGSVSLDSPLG